MHPVIFNPALPDDVEGNAGIGQERHLLQPQGEVYILNPVEEEHLQPIGEIAQLNEEVPLEAIAAQDEPLAFLASPANL